MRKRLLAVAAAVLLALGLAQTAVFANEPAAAGQSTGYEYDVLSGIRQSPPGTLRMTTGWHNGGAAVDVVHSSGATVNAPVHAYFRHVDGDKVLRTRIAAHRSDYRCKGVRVEILDGDKIVARISLRSRAGVRSSGGRGR